MAEEACVLGSMTLGSGWGGVLVPHLVYMEKSFSRTSQRAHNVISGSWKFMWTHA